FYSFFVLHAPLPPVLSPLSLHDALPISILRSRGSRDGSAGTVIAKPRRMQLSRFVVSYRNVRDGEHVLYSVLSDRYVGIDQATRSEEHTSELQSLAYLVCRLLLEKKKNK